MKMEKNIYQIENDLLKRRIDIMKELAKEIACPDIDLDEWKKRQITRDQLIETIISDTETAREILNV